MTDSRSGEPRDAAPAELYARLQRHVGRAVGPPAAAREPVNEVMIAHWCDAMGDRNPLYASGAYAPPGMLQVWTMRRWAADRPLDSGFEVLALLDEAGFRGVVATNSEQQYLRYLRPGDVLTEETTLESVSEEKATGLGRGHFVTFVHEFRDQGGELVGRMRFRVLKFRMPQQKPAGAAAGGAAIAGGPDGGAAAPAVARPQRPRPAINRDNAFFWRGVRDAKLLIQRCEDCGRLRHPPGPMCPSCHSLRWQSVAASGRGTVHSYVVIHRPVIPPFETPNPIVLVDLEEGVRMAAGIRGVSREQLAIGLAVEVEFLEVDGGLVVPGFRLRSG